MNNTIWVPDFHIWLKNNLFDNFACTIIDVQNNVNVITTAATLESSQYDESIMMHSDVQAYKLGLRVVKLTYGSEDVCLCTQRAAEEERNHERQQLLHGS